MNCWACQTKLIWGGDHNGEDYGSEDYHIVTNLSCPNCDALILVYWDKVEEEEEEEKESADD